MAFTHLPAELIDAICQQACPPDLAALSRTNSFILPIAQRRLYRHLSIAFSSHNLQAVLTLADKPDLAQHVRTFSLRVDSSSIFKSFLRLVATALSRMTELVQLELFIDPSASWILSNTRLTYPHLLRFSSSFSFDQHVAEFLTKTEALLELEVDGTSSALDFPVPVLSTRSIPQLSQFVGSSHVASAIVPGRPVQSIHLPSGDLSEDDVVTLANSTSHMVILSATTSSPPVLILESLARHMPSLGYLRLMTTCDFSEPPQPSFYEQIASALTSFSELKGFELAGLHWGSSPKGPEGEERVWQSQPPVGDIIGTEDMDEDLDLFYVF
ncbi:hypothetical protein H0H92_001598 [Tricholoma furcatifolium]|nr:hypothetical protein H0H92_001598 [Tricholoma furcatifolium]